MVASLDKQQTEMRGDAFGGPGGHPTVIGPKLTTERRKNRALDNLPRLEV